MIDGVPYIEFTSHYLNDFALVEPNGIFVVNGDASSTPAQQVTLNNAVAGATGMRFSNN